ncbi:3-keto-disaccharide hydrolase [Spongiimicrobium salis]|uniref:3-keto-disaccharide hydrolase n=1 Tax=Spongiimicrobium salis TaxID=1667022 RepID=UPI00374D8B7A
MFILFRLTKVCCLFITLSLVFSSCQHQQEEDWTSLLDEDLSHWDTYLSYKHQLGYNGDIPKDDEGNPISPIGINKDPFKVFSIIEEDHETVLKVSGEVYGCVSTKEEYANYHLRIQFKWGDKKWDPRKNLLKDSGILYHSIGPFGVEHWRSWMLSQEFQIMEGHLGDYWNQANSAIDIRAYIPEYIMNPVADVSQDFIGIGEGEAIPSYCMRSGNYENPHGEWNTLELICFEDKSIHIVNGKTAMVLRNSRYVEDGKKVPMTKGKIQLQSEAAELYYKNIEIRSLEAIPTEYQSYFE